MILARAAGNLSLSLSSFLNFTLFTFQIFVFLFYRVNSVSIVTGKNKHGRESQVCVCVRACVREILNCIFDALFCVSSHFSYVYWTSSVTCLQSGPAVLIDWSTFMLVLIIGLLDSQATIRLDNKPT